MNRKKRKRSARSSARKAEESQSAEAVTVAWMLALLSTFGAQCVAVLVHLLIAMQGPSDRLRVLAITLLLVALVSGAFTVALTPVVMKLRNVPPPRAIVIAACFMGLIPWVTLLLIALSGSA